MERASCLVKKVGGRGPGTPGPCLFAITPLEGEMI